MALFQFGKKDPTEMLAAGEWTNTNERDALIAQVLGANGIVDVDKVVGLVFSNDQGVRRAALNRIKALANPLAAEVFLQQIPGKPAAITQGVLQVLPAYLPKGFPKKVERFLEHKDIGIRRAAADLLMGGPLDVRLVELGRSWLDAGEDHRRAERLMEKAEQEIRASKTPRGDVVSLARYGAEHPDEAVRLVAYRTLVSTGDPEYLPFFIESIGRETYNNQQLLADAIGRLVRRAGSDMGHAILPLLASTNPALRTTAVDVLRKLDNREAIIKSFFTFARTLAPWIRDRAFDTLGDLGEILLPPLIAIMEEDDPELQLMAVQLASTVGEDERMLAPLGRLLTTAEDWWVRSTAAEGLARIGDPSAVGPLKELLVDPDAVWIAIDGLAQLARQLAQAGKLRDASSALEPLGQFLLAGQADQPAARTEEAIELRLEILTQLRQIAAPRILDLLKQVALKDCVQRVRVEAYALAQSMSTEIGKPIENEEEIQAAVEANTADIDQLAGLDRLLSVGREREASDIHLTVTRPPMFRIQGRLTELDHPSLDASQTASLVRSILTDAQAERLAANGQLEFCYEIPEIGRYRAGIFVDRRGVNAVFRVIPRKLPTIHSIALPAKFQNVKDWHQGLLLVCGASGSGKTTTLAALVNFLNESRQAHVLTLEDPIEYLHRSRRCLVNQRELTTHTGGYAAALRGALRQDPDVIVIGDLKDPETIKLALEASETGHLVVGTLNCTRAETAIHRIVGAFEPDEQAQARIALADALKAILAQTLLPRADGSGMLAVYEVIMGLQTVSAVIRDNKPHLVASLMQTGRAHGMQTFDDALMDLVRAGAVTARVAHDRANSKELFAPMLGEAPGSEHA